MNQAAYQQLWNIVDGGVSDAFNNHPDYLTPKGKKSARNSIVKRVTGTVLSFAEQSARGRVQPAETMDRVYFPDRQAIGAATSVVEGGVVGCRPQSRPCKFRLGKIRVKSRPGWGVVTKMRVEAGIRTTHNLMASKYEASAQ